MPFRIKRIVGNRAILSDGRRADFRPLTGLKAGDYVLANANLVIGKISAAEAEEIKNYFDL